MTKNSKGFGEILIVVLLAVVGIWVVGSLIVGSSFVVPTPTTEPTPTPVPTTNWKLYEGKDYAVKYPPDWYLGPFTSNCEFNYNPNSETVIIADFCVPQDPMRSITGSSIRIEIETENLNKEAGDTFDKFLAAIDKLLQGSSVKLTDEELKFAGYKAIKQVRKTEDKDVKLESHYIFIDKENKVYWIGYTLNDLSKDKGQIVDQILATFKFLN